MKKDSQLIHAACQYLQDGDFLNFSLSIHQIENKSLMGTHSEYLLFEAIKSQDSYIIDMLLEYDIDPGTAFPYGYIHPYTLNQNDRIMQKLIDKSKQLLWEKRIDRTPMLIIAIELKATAAIDNILKLGAHPDVYMTGTDISAMHKAIDTGDLNLVKKLIEHGASLDFRTEYQKTPLYIAAEKGYTQIIEYLLSLGADPNARMRDNRTATICAARRGDANHLKLMMNAGGDVWLKDNDRRSAVDVARSHRNRDTPGREVYDLILPELIKNKQLDVRDVFSLAKKTISNVLNKKETVA